MDANILTIEMNGAIPGLTFHDGPPDENDKRDIDLHLHGRYFGTLSSGWDGESYHVQLRLPDYKGPMTLPHFCLGHGPTPEQAIRAAIDNGQREATAYLVSVLTIRSMISTPTTKVSP